MESFGTRLHRAVSERGPLCVGIDPHPGLLARWGLADDLAGLERFSRTVVEALGDRVAVVKPQSAFFERFGSRGVAILESTIRQLRDAGSLVLLDVKRGDIGSTVSAYASAYLDPSSPLYVDAVTASPYLGVGSLAPMFELAAEHGGGVFVLALTSNPEGAAVQRARTADGRTVAQTVIDEISQLNAGATPLGSFGLVVGATIGDTGHDLSGVGVRCSRRGSAHRVPVRRICVPSSVRAWPRCSRRTPGRCCPQARTPPPCGPPRTGCWTSVGPFWLPGD
ncbi:hypothetical protein GCM10027614_77210 [Micromonospora vulcania]